MAILEYTSQMVIQKQFVEKKQLLIYIFYMLAEIANYDF